MTWICVYVFYPDACRLPLSFLCRSVLVVPLQSVYQLRRNKARLRKCGVALFDVSIDYIMCNKVDSMRGRDWNWYGDDGIGECKTGDFICKGIPHAAAIAKALRYMTEEQRDTLLRICSILYPAEFAEILRPRGND